MQRYVMIEVWREFIENYCKDKINEILSKYDEDGHVKPSIEIDVKNRLRNFLYSRNLEDLFEKKPDMVINMIKSAVKDICKTHIEIRDLNVRFVNLPRRFLIKDLNHRFINRFVSVEGIVRKVYEPKPVLRYAVFECPNCFARYGKEEEGGYVQRPFKCERCGERNLMLNVDESELTDIQKIQIQDLPENLESSEPPKLLDVYLYDDLTGRVLPGDKVIINGILRIKGTKKFRAELDVYLEANSIEFIDQDVRNIQITERDKEEIRRLAKREDIYDLLIQSIAPSIHGYETIKEAIVLQLFGGIMRINPDGTKQRGDIHILLVGDPATSKSQILRAVKQIAPRAILATGYASTGAGLTATAVKAEDGRWTLEAGALVLADRGIALIDEIEKMNKKDRRYMLESLEQMTISIAKAGINATLNTRCSVLACANPRRGRFDRHEPIVEQIDLDPPLLSRFDLIFVVLDEPDDVRDKEIAKTILTSDVKTKMPKIDPDLFKKYVMYARNEVRDIVLDEKAEEKIVDFYIKLRMKSKEQGAIAITARQLEALRRLAEASAKVRLSGIATVEDAERAIRIFEESMGQIAIDPETGKLDIDFAISGVSATQRDRIAIIKNIVKDLEETTVWGAPEEEIIEKAKEFKILGEKVRETLEKLTQKGELYRPRYGYYRVAEY